ncbi:MAG: DUF1937 family protein [Chlamydiae bacterium]|nr:DUF1937 family protein [Chlamydiota bacterium]
MKHVKLIYLACPYRDEDLNVRKKRCAAAHFVAAELSSQGHHVFSPLTHNEILVDLTQNLPGAHWLEFDLAILSICKKLLILKLEGWEDSKGVQVEIAFAKKNGIPIEEMMPPEEAKFLHIIRPSLPKSL